MDDKVKLVWLLTPPDFLPDNTTFELNQVDPHEFVFSSGRLESIISLQEYQSNLGIFDKLTAELNAYLDVVQLRTTTPYRLRKTEKLVQNVLHCLVEPAGSIASGVAGGNVVVVDVDGSVIYDQSEEKIRQEQQLLTDDASFANQCLGYRNDPVLLSLLQSYKAACADKDDELVHLYEIRDIVEKFFGDAKKARETLSMSRTDWSNFGRICNVEPLPQGRHRGRNSIGGNNMGPVEVGASVASAREFARTIIRRYVSHLDGQALP